MVEYSQEQKYSRPKDIKDILTIALEKEKAAYGFYEDMLKHSFAKASMVADLLNRLKKAEAAHVKWVERELAQLKSPF